MNQYFNGKLSLFLTEVNFATSEEKCLSYFQTIMLLHYHLHIPVHLTTFAVLMYLQEKEHLEYFIENGTKNPTPTVEINTISKFLPLF